MEHTSTHETTKNGFGAGTPAAKPTEAPEQSLTARDRFNSQIERGRDRVNEVAARAHDGLDSATSRAGAGIVSAADSMEGIGVSAGRNMRTAGRYLQDSTPTAMRDDLVLMMKKHPGATFAVGLGAGMLLARALRSSRH